MICLHTYELISKYSLLGLEFSLELSARDNAIINQTTHDSETASSID